METYKTKTIFVEAYQSKEETCIETPVGVKHVDPGDYIVVLENGSRGSCKPEVFNAIYEKADDDITEWAAEPSHGYFTPGGNAVRKCAKCGWVFGAHMIYPDYRFCPMCGRKAKMYYREVQQ